MYYKAISIKASSSAKGAMTYLLQKKDWQGKIRNEIEIIRGNPTKTTQIADNLDFKYKYSSAVIAFHKDDKPTLEQMDEVLDNYEKIAFAGLEKDRFSYYAIRHDDHIHIITARVDIETGKSYNPNPPGWENIYDPFTKIHNAKYDWERPDIKKQEIKINAIDIHKDFTKQMLHEHFTQKVEVQQIRNRDELVRYARNELKLKINRQTNDSISFKLDDKKPIKLKGDLYIADYDYSKFRKEKVEVEKLDHNKENERFEKIIERRASYNNKRYITKDERDQIKDFNKEVEQAIKKEEKTNDRIRARIDERNRDVKRDLQTRNDRNHEVLQSRIRENITANNTRISSNANKAERYDTKAVSNFAKLREYVSRIGEQFRRVKNSFLEKFDKLKSDVFEDANTKNDDIATSNTIKKQR